MSTDQESGWLVSSILRDRGSSEQEIEVFFQQASELPPYEPVSSAELNQMIRKIEARRRACGFESIVETATGTDERFASRPIWSAGPKRSSSVVKYWTVVEFFKSDGKELARRFFKATPNVMEIVFCGIFDDGHHSLLESSADEIDQLQKNRNFAYLPEHCRDWILTKTFEGFVDQEIFSGLNLNEIVEIARRRRMVEPGSFHLSAADESDVRLFREEMRQSSRSSNRRLWSEILFSVIAFGSRALLLANDTALSFVVGSVAVLVALHVLWTMLLRLETELGRAANPVLREAHTRRPQDEPDEQ